MNKRRVQFFLLGAVLGSLSAFVYALRYFVPTAFAKGGPLDICFGDLVLAGCTDNSFWLGHLPGLIFGIGIAVILVRVAAVSFKTAMLFTFASALSYVIALRTAPFIWRYLGNAVDFILPDGVDQNGPIATAAFYLILSLTGFCAGALGGGLLALASQRLLRLASVSVVVWAGAVLGLALIFYPILSIGLLGEGPLGVFVFFIIWQAGYASALAKALQE